MNLDQLKARFPDESACRTFFENIIWQNGRRCPHCHCEISYFISGPSSRPGLYECGRCKRQFTVTTRTPMHSTKLPLWKWLLCMYFMVNSSKGISSVFLAKWLGVAQRTGWKMAHAVRELMKPGPDGQPPLGGIVELDEKYFGGKPRYKEGIKHKRGKGTDKQAVFVAVQRQGQARSALIDSDKFAEINPLVQQFVEKGAQLMTDENHAYQKIGKNYASHCWVNHSAKEYACGDVHNNTAESFNSLLERAKQGVFHYMSKKHLQRYLDEIGFRWAHRMPTVKVTKHRKKKIVMVSLPVMELLHSLLDKAAGRQLRRAKNGGIFHPIVNVAATC